MLGARMHRFAAPDAKLANKRFQLSTPERAFKERAFDRRRS